MNDSLENRFQHAGQGVVDDPIPIGSRTDLPFLRFVNEEAAVGAGPVGLGWSVPHAVSTTPVLGRSGMRPRRGESVCLCGPCQRHGAMPRKLMTCSHRLPWRFMLCCRS